MRPSRPALSAVRFSSIPIVVAMALTTSAPRLAGQGSFTLRGGLNLSKFVGGDAAQSDAKRGLNLGGSLRVVAFGPFSVWAEGYYRQKGADNLQALAEGGTTVPDKVQIGIDYVEIPVLLRMDIPVPWQKVRPYVQGGPAFGWKLDCSITLSSQSGTATPGCDQLLGGNATATLRNYEQGVVLGGGLDLHILGDIGALNLDARVTRGLSRLAQDSGGPDVKNQSITLMLGYSLHAPGIGGSPGGRRF